MARKQLNIPSGTPLRECPERPIGVSVPASISARLDALVDLAEEAGPRLYRKDLVAALILAAPENGEELAELFLQFRRATVDDAAVSDDQLAHVLDLRRRRPGPRPRAG